MRKKYVLSDISLHIDAGQTVGIVGQTGSAKTHARAADSQTV